MNLLFIRHGRDSIKTEAQVQFITPSIREKCTSENKSEQYTNLCNFFWTKNGTKLIFAALPRTCRGYIDNDRRKARTARNPLCTWSRYTYS